MKISALRMYSGSIIRLLAIPLAAAAFLLPELSEAQAVSPLTLTRSKMWIRANPNGSLERESTLGQSGHDWELAYPGYWDNRNEMSGGWDNNAIYHGAQVAGEDVAWMYRNGSFDDQDIYAIGQTALTKNYNFLSNPNAPEEFLYGKIGSRAMDDNGRHHMGYALEGTVMNWSVPGYSDFVIIRCKLTSTDADTLKNFYYARYVTPNGPYRPSSVSSGWDQEYHWEPSLSDTIGFIFYDNTTIPPTSAPPVYSYFPGTITGNAGDPGNIGTQNSRDFKLYSPSLYAFSFLPQTITPNKNGQRKVWRRILSSSSNAPAEELMPGWTSELATYSGLVDIVTNDARRPQPAISWRAAYDSIQAGHAVPGAGSLWERNPRYIYAIGPYDIAPGKSIEWTEIFLAGAMNRNVTMLGDTVSTLHFVEEGLKNLKSNWAAARSLIAGNYRFPAGKIPPPTPADAPRVGNANELAVAASAVLEGGERKPGVDITWTPIPSGYVDPQSGRADFLGYRVYRSNNSIEGPWSLDSLPSGRGILTRAEAESIRLASPDTTKITLFLPAPVGIPYRYCVTSVDTGGNESAMTAYNYYPVAAEPNPSDNQSSIVVVPNPFRQVSGYSDQAENKRLAFYNIPAKCTIRIYSVALDLIRTLEHDGAGLQTWGSQNGKDYMLTDFGQNVMPGVYIFHVESHVPGHEGETSVGKFAIIR